MISFFKLALKCVDAARRPLGMCMKHRKQTQQYTRKRNEFPKQAPHEIAKWARRMSFQNITVLFCKWIFPMRAEIMEEGEEYTLESFYEL